MTRASAESLLGKPSPPSAVAAGAALALLALASPARAENVPPQLVEGDLAIAFGEGLGRSPLVLPSAGLELGAGSLVGLAAYGTAVVAVPSSLPFLEQTESGGGLTLAVRLFFRGTWPRGFSVGVAGGMAVAGGVAIFQPRAEVSYRWIVLGGLALRVQGLVGGTFLWDTAEDDDRVGPEEGSASGLLLGFGVGIGWSLVGDGRDGSLADD